MKNATIDRIIIKAPIRIYGTPNAHDAIIKLSLSFLSSSFFRFVPIFPRVIEIINGINIITVISDVLFFSIGKDKYLDCAQ